MKIDYLENLSPETLAYVAGIIDGEGTIFVGYLGGKRNTSYPVLRIAMTYRPIIEWLEKTLDTCKNYRHNRKNPNPRAKPCYACTLYGKKAQKVCEKTLPYLKVKHKQAKLLLQFPMGFYKGPGIKIDLKTKKSRQLIKLKISKLNKRGVDVPLPNGNV